MLQVLIKKGGIVTDNIPSPSVTSNGVLIKVHYSCVSLGTESSTVQDSGKSLYQKAKEKPEKVKKVLSKLIADGPVSTLSMVRGELNISNATGYSLSGEVIAVGKDVAGFQVGDLVAAAGGTANHAEIVNVPHMLVSKLESRSELKVASSVAIGSIALHGVRRAGLLLGETCVVIGAGIIGLITIQLLVKSGVRVFVIDLDEKKLKLASELGAEKTLVASDSADQVVQQWAGNIGVDAVLFTAATSSSEPLSQAFKMCRRKGKVVLVGVSGMQISRADIYKNEVDFQISASYGPGRYDNKYEQDGQDYPISYVRWTEGRNMEEYLRLLRLDLIDVDQLITSTVDIENAESVFAKRDGSALNLMNIIKYSSMVEQTAKVTIIKNTKPTSKIVVGLIGASGFAKNITLPFIKKNPKFELKAICSRTGVKPKDLAANAGASYITSDVTDLLEDEDINLIIITTQHNSHGDLVLKALQAGKNVYVEKPLATKQSEVDAIKAFYKDKKGEAPLLAVGFNRRFSKYATEIKKVVSQRINPMIITYRMNAGYVPYDSWIHEDGGRIVGEACHLVDLASFLTGSKIISINVESLNPNNEAIKGEDNKSLSICYADGSIVVINYFSVGSKQLSKEYMEVHFDNQSIIMDDYMSLKGYGSRVKPIKTSKSSKGHEEFITELGKSLTGADGSWPIPLDQLLETTEATIAVIKA